MRLLAERFTANDPRIEMVPESGCWVWMRHVWPKTGYGCASMAKGHNVLAHRAFFEQANGPIPDGLVLDHVCRVRSCVNPAHLRAVTQRENLLAVGSMGFSGRNAAKTECPKCGRPFTLIGTRPGRQCVPCQRALVTEWKRRNRAAKRALRG